MRYESLARIDSNCQIWLEDGNGKKTQVAGDAVQDFEPLYGPTYLPRKWILFSYGLSNAQVQNHHRGASSK